MLRFQYIHLYAETRNLVTIAKVQTTILYDENASSSEFLRGDN